MLNLLIAGCCMGAPQVKPVLAFQLDGTVVSPTPVRWRPGTQVMRTPGGSGLHFDGILSGWSVPDSPELALCKSITVSAWLNPEAYVDRGPGAQILFRGDDRSGLDPYSFVIHPDGRIYFSVQNEKDVGEWVAHAIPLNSWTHVVASFDAEIGLLRMYVNGQILETKWTKVRPFAKLSTDGAGVGVGNIQWDRGPHNQPFHGTVADLRLYAAVITPKDVGYSPSGWNQPYLE